MALTEFQRKALSTFFFLGTVGTSIYIIVKLYLHPLQKFDVNNLDWLKPWFYASLVDYYGASVALTTIAVLSEPYPRNLLWAAGFNLIGSPCIFTFMFYRTFYKKGLRLQEEEPVADEKIAATKKNE